MTRVLASLAAVVAALFAAACGAGVALQDRLVYRPSADAADPTRDDTAVVLVATEDGETLRAWWRPPEPGRPVFLYLGGNAERLDHSEGRLRRIAAQGAGALVVAYRGYSGSTGRPSEPGLHADARAAYAWLIAEGVAAGDIVIHGFSLGAGPATRLAAERDARALVLEAPFTSLDDLAGDLAPLVPWRWVLRSRFANRDWIGAVDEPVLVAHGDADTVIPFSHGERLFALADEPKRFVRMRGSDHATLTRDGLYDQIWAFLDGA